MNCPVVYYGFVKMSSKWRLPSLFAFWLYYYHMDIWFMAHAGKDIQGRSCSDMCGCSRKPICMWQNIRGCDFPSLIMPFIFHNYEYLCLKACGRIPYVHNFPCEEIMGIGIMIWLLMWQVKSVIPFSEPYTVDPENPPPEKDYDVYFKTLKEGITGKESLEPTPVTA